MKKKNNNKTHKDNKGNGKINKIKMKVKEVMKKHDYYLIIYDKHI